MSEMGRKRTSTFDANNDEDGAHGSQPWFGAMVVAFVGSWSCALAGLLHGFSFLQVLAILVVSGLLVFVLTLGFSTLAQSLWVIGVFSKLFRRVCAFLRLCVSFCGSGQDGSRLANQPRRNCASLAGGVVELEPEAPTEPANWMQVLHDQSSVDRGRCFVLADTSVPQSRQLAYDLSQIGFDVDMCDDSEVMIGTLLDKPGDCPWSLLVIDLDFFEAMIGVDEVIDELQSLRVRIKSLSVVVLSNEIRRYGNETSRLTIADVSLVTPVSLYRLRRGIWDAQSNNMIWQGRVQETMGPACQSLTLRS